MDKYGTKNRQKAIKKLIDSYEIGSQTELVERLAEDWGIKTTQTVVSRDLKVLGVARKIHDGKRVYAMPEKDVEKEILKLGIKDIQHNEAIIVITTPPGLAPYVGDAVDAVDVDILGSLSGENTVFVTPKTTKEIKKIFKELCKALKFKPLS